MKILFLTLITTYFAHAAEVEQTIEQKPNILLICVDDLRPELPSFGKKYIKAPAMEQLFREGRLFKRHYVQAPTCGASRFALLTGLFPRQGSQLSNGAIVKHDHKKQLTFPAWFKKHGYTTVAVGKVSHYPGGNTGAEWNDAKKPEIPNAWSFNVNTSEVSGEWKTPQKLMHGYANGKHRTRGKTPPFEAMKDGRYPDDIIYENFTKQLDFLAKDKKPWLLAVGFIRPHLPFACDKKYLDLYENVKIPNYATPKPAPGEFWSRSGELNSGYKLVKNPNKDEHYATELRKHYAACVSSTDHFIGKVLKSIKAKGLDENTIIVLWGDHGWHLGEQQIWGKHTVYEVALHSPLFIKNPKMKQAGKATEAVVNSIDVYPTLCDLAKLPRPSHLEGKSLIALLNNPQAKSLGVATSYWSKYRSEITNDHHKIIHRKTNKAHQAYNLKEDPKEENNLIKK